MTGRSTAEFAQEQREMRRQLEEARAKLARVEASGQAVLDAYQGFLDQDDLDGLRDSLTALQAALQYAADTCQVCGAVYDPHLGRWVADVDSALSHDVGTDALHVHRVTS